MYVRAAAEAADKCGECGYDLKGLGAKGKCPECGSAYVRRDRASTDELTDRLDRVFTHPVLGVGVFAVVMTGLFYSLFSLAQIPMKLIDSVFGVAADWVGRTLPEGVLTELLANGVIRGIGATVIFLPQICLLFFLISLLEDTGYLARAALLMDRVLRPFGLPGHAFVPLLSSHACALPGIMATRSIPDRRERLATILVAPFMTCSARLPVYVLLTSLLFANKPMFAALAFVGCYALGIFAAVFSALIARRTILRGKGRAMVLELPTYKWPSLWTALGTTKDRGLVFVKNAGTNILMICIALWWLSAYPRVDVGSVEAMNARTWANYFEIHANEIKGSNSPFSKVGEWVTPENRPAFLEKWADDPVKLAWLKSEPLTPEEARTRAADLRSQASHIEAKVQAAHSFAGRLGKFIQPVFRPLGYDWQLTIGVLTSFAAREVFVSTMSVVLAGEKDPGAKGVFQQIAQAKRDDGPPPTPIFTHAVCWSLLVYYVLAMQCLPTLAVTARESGSWKWAALQQVWMSGVAYLAAAVVYQVMK